MMGLSIQWQLAILLAVVGLGQGGCSTNPATGKSQLNILSESREIQIGQEARGPFLKQYGGQIPSQRIVDYVNTLGHRLAKVSERPDLPWEFYVVDSSVINAFALPGGKVFVSRGLLAKLDNEAQLAGVLGHEIGHVTAQHIGQQMARATIFQGVAIGVGVAARQSDDQWLRVLGTGTQVGGGLYLLKFGRNQEVQADALGVRYMAKLGYNPVGQLQVMQVLATTSTSGARQPEFLATHPLPKTRIKKLNRLIKHKYPDYQDPAAYRFNFKNYKINLLDELGKLPPAKHGTKPATPTKPH